MSVLAHDEIVLRMKARDLVISPIMQLSQIGDISVDLRMGATALVVRGGGVAQLDRKSVV